MSGLGGGWPGEIGPGEVTEDLMGRADFRGQESESGSGQGYFAIRSEANTAILLTAFGGVLVVFSSVDF